MFYFAYGSNLNKAQMAKRCPDSEPLYLGNLENMRFIINSRGVASVAPERNSSVRGLIWKISPKDEKNLDRYEGVAHNLYTKEKLKIVSEGQTTFALVYKAVDDTLGRPRLGYLETILQGIEDTSSDKKWYSEVKSWAGFGQ